MCVTETTKSHNGWAGDHRLIFIFLLSNHFTCPYQMANRLLNELRIVLISSFALNRTAWALKKARARRNKWRKKKPSIEKFVCVARMYWANKHSFCCLRQEWVFVCSTQHTQHSLPINVRAFGCWPMWMKWMWSGRVYTVTRSTQYTLRNTNDFFRSRTKRVRAVVGPFAHNDFIWFLVGERAAAAERVRWSEMSSSACT